MVTCNYHGINFHVYFLVEIFVTSIKGPALCYPFITSLIYICIIVVITNCV